MNYFPTLKYDTQHIFYKYFLTYHMYSNTYFTLFIRILRTVCTPMGVLWYFQRCTWIKKYYAVNPEELVHAIVHKPLHEYNIIYIQTDMQVTNSYTACLILLHIKSELSLLIFSCTFGARKASRNGRICYHLFVDPFFFFCIKIPV